jgi:hypothetical protein
MSFYQVSGGYIGLEYTIGSSSTWYVRFAYLSLNVPPPPSSSLTATSGSVGISGYKLIFRETMNNSFSSLAIINYFWSFSVDAWNGSYWVATGLGTSTPLWGAAIPALTTMNLPYYVCLVDSSVVNSNEWLKINFLFVWTYNSTNYPANYTAKLNVHPADTSGSAVTFPYFGADGKVSTADLTLLAKNWGRSVSWTGTFDPTDELHRADQGMYGKVGTGDLTILATNWGLKGAWTNTPPPG